MRKTAKLTAKSWLSLTITYKSDRGASGAVTSVSTNNRTRHMISGPKGIHANAKTHSRIAIPPLPRRARNFDITQTRIEKLVELGNTNGSQS
jgi:hypothetical protein